ncbi:MAG: butyrate kinase [Halanaerobiales bacterium]
MFKLLVINPGSTSTKLSIFEDEIEVWSKNIQHKSEEIRKFEKIIDQFEWRETLTKKVISDSVHKFNELDAVVARGGVALDPLLGGTYLIDENMVNDLEIAKNSSHASNLAGIIAYNLGREYNIPAYTVDPISVDEFDDLARLSGLPEINRKCQSHALNLKAIGRKTSEYIGKDFEEANLVGVHLGGGISIASLRKGKIVDVNNANQGGPYSPERVGTLPSLGLVEYIYDNNPDHNKFVKKLLGNGGLMAYLGTNDGLEIEERIKNGDQKAKLVYEGMIYQITKEIGAMATVLNGDVDAIFITGGLAKSKYITNRVVKKIKYISEVLVYPGAEEMENLAKGALRVLKKEEEYLEYEEGKIDTEIF